MGRRSGNAVERQLLSQARRFVTQVVPQSARALKNLASLAQAIPEPRLRSEALASIALKDFHVHGACILATFLPRERAAHFIELAATFETAVDYLDNLCDRAGGQRESDFRALHESLSDAVTPGAPLRQYFRERKADDGGYLGELVHRSQRLFDELPGYAMAREPIAELTQRYCDLQACKHLAPGEREARCQSGFGSLASDLAWWEGAAACGSTLPTFALAYAAATSAEAAGVKELYHAYFPYVSAFHILLDYFIDQREDADHGELNFVSAYGDAGQAREGIARIGRAALARLQTLPERDHHVFALHIMCGFYCTRSKVERQGLTSDASAIARAVGVDLADGIWRLRAAPGLRPLLALYERVSRL